MKLGKGNGVEGLNKWKSWGWGEGELEFPNIGVWSCNCGEKHTIVGLIWKHGWIWIPQIKIKTSCILQINWKRNDLLGIHALNYFLSSSLLCQQKKNNYELLHPCLKVMSALRLWLTAPGDRWSACSGCFTLSTIRRWVNEPKALGCSVERRGLELGCHSYRGGIM